MPSPDGKPLPCLSPCPLSYHLSRDNTVLSYPIVETIHKDNICHVTEAPADVPPAVAAQARGVAEKAIACLDGAGIFGWGLRGRVRGRARKQGVARAGGDWTGRASSGGACGGRSGIGARGRAARSRPEGRRLGLLSVWPVGLGPIAIGRGCVGWGNGEGGGLGEAGCMVYTSLASDAMPHSLGAVPMLPYLVTLRPYPCAFCGCLPPPLSLSVEMFLLGDGTILLNEVAPRPHNRWEGGAHCNCHVKQNARAVLRIAQSQRIILTYQCCLH